MEGPSLVILNEELMPFIGKKVLKVTGNTKQPKEELKGCTLSQVDTWAKVLFMTFTPPQKNKDSIITKTHFLLFGSYRINEPKENRSPRLELKFDNGVLYLYSCSINFDAKEALESVDREVDVMAPEWNEDHVVELMAKKKDSYLCDLFLDQNIFAGSGNIVKNEVLFNIRKHPLTKLSEIDKKYWPELAHEVRNYCFNFYEWKKKYELMRHWQVYRRHYCPICSRKLIKEKMGKGKRGTFYCEHCQKQHSKKFEVYEVLPMRERKGKKERFDH